MSRHSFFETQQAANQTEAELSHSTNTVAALAQEKDLSAFEEAAEDCVLARYKAMRTFGVLPSHLPPLSREERLERLQTLLTYWQTGCCYALDERLVADIIRRREEAKA